MTNKQQEALFVEVLRTHPKRSRQWASGYVHGTLDETIRRDPNPTYLAKDDDYAQGYGRGWRDHRGD
jgi:hypothetical protein